MMSFSFASGDGDRTVVVSNADVVAGQKIAWKFGGYPLSPCLSLFRSEYIGRGSRKAWFNLGSVNRAFLGKGTLSEFHHLGAGR